MYSSDRFGFWKPTSTSSQSIQKATQSSNRTLKEARGKAAESDTSDDDKDQGRIDDDDDKQMYVSHYHLICNITVFGQHEGNSGDKHENGTQDDLDLDDANLDDANLDDDNLDNDEDFNHQPDTQEKDFDDDSKDEARDKTEESCGIPNFGILHRLTDTHLSIFPPVCILGQGLLFGVLHCLADTHLSVLPLACILLSYGQGLQLSILHHLSRHASKYPSSRMQSPRRHSPSRPSTSSKVSSQKRSLPKPAYRSDHARSPTHSRSRSATPDKPDLYRNQRKTRTAQEDPTKLGFYPPAWQTFLQAAKLEMCLQAILMHPVPEHRDALQLAHEVIDTELWIYHEKKIKLDNGYFPQYQTQMVRLLCDDLFTFCTELKKVVVSITKTYYGIFPKGAMARKEEMQKCVTANATKLLKTNNYLQ
ncbi:uncharacterized protein F5147DRAFT_776826 [Suillus discolor]|uniref:DUF6532 domain-containing protein n=1 Tax=Suillus discolor TaxID=1912936 RepID=A0A9P7F0C5_9AGAM|nr:uncharacterized protein F5147DRAFT_776826 [Suillus discolor]KAG2101099.1 hypothetical protein F5147DRAFT_776826 [Suillus discolor]